MFNEVQCLSCFVCLFASNDNALGLPQLSAPCLPQVRSQDHVVAGIQPGPLQAEPVLSPWSWRGWPGCCRKRSGQGVVRTGASHSLLLQTGRGGAQMWAGRHWLQLLPFRM